MDDTLVKAGPSFEVRARYENSRVLLYLRSREDNRNYGDYPGQFLSAEEWDALVAWVNWQRAREKAVRASRLIAGS